MSQANPTRSSRHGISRDEWTAMAPAFCKRGEDLPQAKLTADRVRRIRRNACGWPAWRWAEHFGLHVRTIEKVLRRASWSHVE